MDLSKIMKSTSYVQLCMIFVVAVLLKELNIIPSYFLNFRLFAYILPLFSIPALMKLEKSSYSKVSHIWPILLFLCVIIFLVRLIPYFHTVVPLGYDPGFYKYTIELYSNNLPDIPENSLPHWVKEMYPQGLFILTDLLYIFGGFDANLLFKLFFPFLCAFLILPLFVLTRHLFDDRTAIIASFLYTLSYTQYTMFTFLYFKNVIGLMFLLLAIYLLEKKKYIPLILIYAGLGIYHRPEFLLFSLILVFYFLRTKEANLILVALITAILIAPFWLSRIAENLSLISDVAEKAVITVQAGQVSGGGTFFGFETYEWVSLAYLPFGLIGFMYVLLKKKWDGLFYGFLINGAIVIFQLFFFKRLIVSLDIFLIILAGAGLNYGFLESRMVSKKLGIFAVIFLLISSSIVLLDQVSNTRPLIDDDELEAVKWLASNTEPNSYILATSYDAPWVLGWSNRRVIAPGLFEWNIYNKSEWIAFLKTKDIETTEDFLRPYSNNSIYIYHSKRRTNWMEMSKFENPSFEIIEFNKVTIYKKSTQ